MATGLTVRFIVPMLVILTAGVNDADAPPVLVHVKLISISVKFGMVGAPNDVHVIFAGTIELV